MNISKNKSITEKSMPLLRKLRLKNEHRETEFLQTVQEVAETIIPFIEEHPKYQDRKLLNHYGRA